MFYQRIGSKRIRAGLTAALPLAAGLVAVGVWQLSLPQLGELLTSSPAVAATAEPAPPLQKGVNYGAWFSGRYASASSDFTVTNLIRPAGVEWLALPVACYQQRPDSTTIDCASRRTPTDDDIRHVIRLAHRLGMKVLLRPQVGSEGEWGHVKITQGNNEAGWTAWFASYRTFITRYAALAAQEDVEQFSIGSELPLTTHREKQWREIIAAVRAVYPGRVTYSAHLDDVQRVRFWDALDFIGVDAYYPLTNKNTPTVAELKTAWQQYVPGLARLSARWQRPIVFTEIGYRSRDGANRNPGEWRQQAAVNLQEQRNAYQAAFETFWGGTYPWFRGMFWWQWFVDPQQGGSNDTNYTPHDKPAEQVLRTFYGGEPKRAPVQCPDSDKGFVIYGDALASGWQSRSRNATVNFAHRDANFRGTQAISLALDSYGALTLTVAALNTRPYTCLDFYIHGNGTDRRDLWVFFRDATGRDLVRLWLEYPRYLEGGTVAARSWRHVRIPLFDLGADNSEITALVIQDRSGKSQAPFLLDEIALTGGSGRVP